MPVPPSCVVSTAENVDPYRAPAVRCSALDWTTALSAGLYFELVATSRRADPDGSSPVNFAFRSPTLLLNVNGAGHVTALSGTTTSRIPSESA